MLDAPSGIIASVRHRSLEGVGLDIDKLREAQRDERVLPHRKTLSALLEEDQLPAVITQTGQIAVIGPVKKLLALAGAGTGQDVALVVAVEVDLEGLACRLVAGQQLFFHVRLA